MYVRKFEADTLDEALKSIKKELGPDAIILKTITNKGIKGAFKKKKIEITAAISEKNYSKKIDVDKALSDEQKEKFYSSDAGYIAEQINRKSGHSRSNESVASNYGKMGLNKQVNSIKNIGDQIKSGLDDFLNAGVEKVVEKVEREEFQRVENQLPMEDEFYLPDVEERIVDREDHFVSIRNTEVENNNVSNFSQEMIDDQSKKIEELEKKLFELTKNIERIDKKEPHGIYNLRTTLRSMDISENYLQDLIKKALFEFSPEDLENFESVFEFALRDMMSTLKTDMPRFSSLDVEGKSVITVLVSDSSSGQSTMCKKLASLKDNVKYICLEKETTGKGFAEKMFNIDTVKVATIPEVISETRKAVEEQRNVIIDFKTLNLDQNDTKKFVESIRRTFDHVEVLVCLSAIHSELYNMKVLNKYKSISNGIVLANLDLCLNFGTLFNLSEEFPGLPYKFFGTGELIPDDIESATAERILAGIFQFE